MLSFPLFGGTSSRVLKLMWLEGMRERDVPPNAYEKISNDTSPRFAGHLLISRARAQSWSDVLLVDVAVVPPVPISPNNTHQHLNLDAREIRA